MGYCCCESPLVWITALLLAFTVLLAWGGQHRAFCLRSQHGGQSWQPWSGAPPVRVRVVCKHLCIAVHVRVRCNHSILCSLLCFLAHRPLGGRVLSMLSCCAATSYRLASWMAPCCLMLSRSACCAHARPRQYYAVQHVAYARNKNNSWNLIFERNWP